MARISVVGAGPNGLTAAAVLAVAGHEVTVFEAAEEFGGATRSADLTGGGGISDIGSAVHPIGAQSPVFKALELERYGLEWAHPEIPLAHPLDGRPAALMHADLATTAAELDVDERAWKALYGPLVPETQTMLESLLSPLLPMPKHLMRSLGFLGLSGLPAAALQASALRGEDARALFAGIALHSALPLERLISSGFGIVLGAIGQRHGWPFARGGSQAIARALGRLIEEHGGTIRTGHRITDLREVTVGGERPDVTMLSLTPAQLLRLEGFDVPEGYRRRLARFRYGPGVVRVEFELSEPVPWSDPRLAGAGTLHLCGTAAECAAAERAAHSGGIPERPFVLAAQQDAADASRRPSSGGRLLWTYARLSTARGLGPEVETAFAGAIEDQVERFAPGFRDTVVARHVMGPAALEAFDANLVGGDIIGGAMGLRQQLFRPVASLDPYRTPMPGVFLCSSSVPPGGAVHGMPGLHGAASAMRWLEG
ncbi:phytoene desaturase family protein [Sediminivirga luteola]|uniref:phytoene desaturase family protein n=1 Tax=Sediminivirga luteola TaxID=1774748 RepID=UPI0024127E6F|nr:NAD(P)/FAD-dependent oxidoreductase [Sediminivirga luteola]